MRLLYITLTFFLTISTIFPNTGKAGIIEDAWGFTTDPIKLGKAADSAREVAASIERTMAEIKILEAQTNLDLKDRIYQIERISQSLTQALNENVENIGSITRDALFKISEMESQTNKDAISLIYRTQCAGEEAVDQQIPKLIQDLVEKIKNSEPGISIFGIEILKFKVNSIKLDDPDIAYRELKKIYFTRLASIKPESDAYIIPSTYNNLARLARLARCNYIDDPNASVYFDREINDLQRLSAPWGGFVKL